MYQVIARKYRPQAFDELISQEHVKTTLENAITQQRIAHGYIFSGQRGTGKTTVARIFARCLNCEQGPTPTPCGKCASCLEIAAGSSMDVIEIDAASNRGINEMRELRESVRFRPARDRYKVFIVDEAHQITSEAFNALLKTLEEPPEWVVFLLCTTESHKIPSTIVSRCQQFSFRSVDFAELVARMEWIMQQEGITADADAVAVLARAGEGSVRDSLSALDQAIACCGDKLDAAEVRALLGMFSLESLGRVTSALAEERLAKNVRRGRRTRSQRPQPAAFRPRAGAPLPQPGGGENRRQRDPPGGGIAGRAAETGRGGAPFSEEDLTRYLQLSLDLFRDSAKLAPAAPAPGNGIAADGPSRPLAADRRSAGEPGRAVAPPRAATASKPAPPAPQQVPRPPVRSLEAAISAPACTPRCSKPSSRTSPMRWNIPNSPSRPTNWYSPRRRCISSTSSKPEFEAAAKRIAGRPVRVTIKIGEPAPQAAPAAAAAQEARRRSHRPRALAPRSKTFPRSFPRTRKCAPLEI